MVMLLEAASFEEGELSALTREACGETRSACRSACLSPDKGSSIIPLEVPDLFAMMQARDSMVDGVRIGHGGVGKRLVLQ